MSIIIQKVYLNLCLLQEDSNTYQSDDWYERFQITDSFVEASLQVLFKTKQPKLKEAASFSQTTHFLQIYPYENWCDKYDKHMLLHKWTKDAIGESEECSRRKQRSSVWRRRRSTTGRWCRLHMTRLDTRWWLPQTWKWQTLTDRQESKNDQRKRGFKICRMIPCISPSWGVSYGR